MFGAGIDLDLRPFFKSDFSKRLEHAVFVNCFNYIPSAPFTCGLFSALPPVLDSDRSKHHDYKPNRRLTRIDNDRDAFTHRLVGKLIAISASGRTY